MLSAPQVVGSFSPLEEFDALVYNPSLTLFHCILYNKKKFIEKFENRKHKDSFMQDLSQTRKINKFRTESHELIADFNNTKIFELCENSSKQQCPDCNLYWEMGIIHFSCGRNVKSTRIPTEFDQNNSGVTTIPGYVMKKNSKQSWSEARSF